MTTPTLTQMEKVYYVAAEVERMKCGRPGRQADVPERGRSAADVRRVRRDILQHVSKLARRV